MAKKADSSRSPLDDAAEYSLKVAKLSHYVSAATGATVLASIYGDDDHARATGIAKVIAEISESSKAWRTFNECKPMILAAAGQIGKCDVTGMESQPLSAVTFARKLADGSERLWESFEVGAKIAKTTEAEYLAANWLGKQDFVRTYFPDFDHDEMVERIEQEIAVARTLEHKFRAHPAHLEKLFPLGVPDSADLRDAILELQTKRSEDNTDRDILREFFDGNDEKARKMESNIRSLRQKGRTTLPPRRERTQRT